MASVKIALPAKMWIQITAADKQGEILQISGNTQVAYVKADVSPVGYDDNTPTIALTGKRGSYNYSGISDKDYIWAYAIDGDASVVTYPSQGLSLNAEAPYFTGTKAMITQSYTEANSKLGVEHEASILIKDVAGNSNFDGFFVTGAMPVSLKGRVISYTGKGVTAEIFTGATFTGGAPIIYQNSSDINPVAGLSQIIAGGTVVDEGTLAFAPNHLIGNESQSGRGASSIVIGSERLFKPNTTYMLRIKSLDNSTQDIASFLRWYEGPLDLPL